MWLPLEHIRMKVLCPQAVIMRLLSSFQKEGERREKKPTLAAVQCVIKRKRMSSNKTSAEVLDFLAVMLTRSFKPYNKV